MSELEVLHKVQPALQALDAEGLEEHVGNRLSVQQIAWNHLADDVDRDELRCQSVDVAARQNIDRWNEQSQDQAPDRQTGLVDLRCGKVSSILCSLLDCAYLDGDNG